MRNRYLSENKGAYLQDEKFDHARNQTWPVYYDFAYQFQNDDLHIENLSYRAVNKIWIFRQIKRHNSR